MRNRINIVVPMLGEAKRFQAAGIWVCKPLVKARGKTLIEWSMSSLGVRGNYIFIIREMDELRFGLEQYLRDTFGSCVVIKTDKPTEGAACSCLLASRFIDNNTPLIITNCDQYYQYNYHSFFRKMFNYNADGGILTFKNDHPKWSYARLNDEGLVAEVAEKKVISEHATCLAASTPVKLADGTTKPISVIVNEKLPVKVTTYNMKTGEFEFSEIRAYIKNDGSISEWYKLLIHDLPKSRGGSRQLIITGDHEVYTNRGMVRVDELKNDDKIATRFLKPTKLQQLVIDGTLLGDGMFRKPDKTGELGRLVLKQSLKQEEYLLFKTSLLKQFKHTIHYEEPKEYRTPKSSGMSNGSIMSYFSANPFWSLQRKRWYSDKKYVPKDIEFHPLVLALWYMDDGSLGSNQKRAVLCTQSFNDNDIEFLQQKFNDIGIETTTQQRESGKMIVINYGNGSSDAFFNLIAPYIIPSMQYKLPEKYRNQYDENLYNDNETPNVFFSEFSLTKDFKCPKWYTKDSYCLNVGPNRTFIANDTIVSNCGTYYWLKGRHFVDAAYKMMKDETKRVNLEWYVAPTMTECIEDGARIVHYPVDVMKGLGTYEDLMEFENGW